MTTAHTDAESAAVEAMTMFGGGGDDDDDDEGEAAALVSMAAGENSSGVVRAAACPHLCGSNLSPRPFEHPPCRERPLESPRACHTRHAASLSAGPPLCLRPRGLNRSPPDCWRPNVADQRCFAVRLARTRSQGRAAFWARTPRGSIPKQLWAPSRPLASLPPLRHDAIVPC